MQGPNPNYIQQIIAALMQPKIQDQFTGDGNVTSVPVQPPVTTGAMPTPIPVQTTTITPPPWTTTTQAAPRGVPPMQLGLPPQPSQSYYNLLSGGYGYDPYKTPV